MKAYLITTGVIFGLITVAHILRMVTEGAHVVREPVYILLTLMSAALSIWALQLLRRSNQTD